MSDYIKRADAIDAVAEEWLSEASAESPYVNDDDIDRYRELAEELFADIPSADAVHGFRGGKIPPKEMLDGTVLIPQHQWLEMERELAELKQEFKSADAVKGEWIPCGEKMPKELERVNVTWLNHNPPVYYQHIKDIPQTDTAVYYRGKWYWWDATVIDILAEYGEDSNAEQIDKDIEVVAWMPLPTPYKGGDDE